MTRKSEIIFTVNTDENHVPEKLQWEATDGGTEGKQECGATMLTVWDPNEQNTLRIDLWTKKMTVEEMRMFCCQNLITMADAFERATGDESAAKELREFGKEFAIKMGVLKAN